MNRAAVVLNEPLTSIAGFGGQEKRGEAPEGHPIVAYAFHPANQPPHALSTNQHMTSDQLKCDWTHNLWPTAQQSLQSNHHTVATQSIVIQTSSYIWLKSTFTSEWTNYYILTYLRHYFTPKAMSNLTFKKNPFFTRAQHVINFRSTIHPKYKCFKTGHMM